MANSVDQDQIGAVCSGFHAVCFFTKFVSNVMQLFAADDIFRCFFLGALRVKPVNRHINIKCICPLFDAHKFSFCRVSSRNFS